MRIETQIKENKKATASEKNPRAGGERETEMRLEVMQSSFVTRVKGRETCATSLVVQWLGFHTVTAMAQVQSLLRELKSCKLHSTASPSPQKRKGGQRDLESNQESRCSYKGQTRTKRDSLLLDLL